MTFLQAIYAAPHIVQRHDDASLRVARALDALGRALETSTSCMLGYCADFDAAEFLVEVLGPRGAEPLCRIRVIDGAIYVNDRRVYHDLHGELARCLCTLPIARLLAP